MQKGLLLEPYTDMKGAYTCRRFLEEAKKQEIDLLMIGIADCLLKDASVYFKGQDLDQMAPEFVINRYKFGMIKDKINALPSVKKSFNPIDAFDRYINKGAEMEDLKELWTGRGEREAVLTFPETLLVHRLSDAEMILRSIKERIGFPVVMKGLTGSCGKEVTLLQDETELEACLLQWKRSRSSEEERIFQKFLFQTAGRDIRSLCVQGEVLASMIRKGPEGDFRSNVALGGTVEQIQPDQVIKEAAARIYEITGLFCFGLDLLPAGSSYAFCEINVMPGLSGIEEASGKNLTGEILDRIRMELKK